MTETPELEDNCDFTGSDVLFTLKNDDALSPPFNGREACPQVCGTADSVLSDARMCERARRRLRDLYDEA